MVERSWQDVLSLLPAHIGTALRRWDVRTPVEEIRLRPGRPALVQTTAGERTVAASAISADDCQQTLQRCCEQSVYAWQDALRAGYVTIAGGHRVGVVGRTVVENGQVRTVQPVTGLNVRIARAVHGAADAVVSAIVDLAAETVHSTLLLSPPGAGKTTVLRDLIRQLSDGRPDLDLPGRTVGVVDERSELAGSWRGVPQHDLGMRTDVLDNCPKAVGLMMLVRSMGPRIVAVDEIGDRADAAAVREAVHAGVGVLATAHARNLTEARARPGLAGLLEGDCFSRVIVLSRRRGPATVEHIYAIGDGGTGDDVHAQAGGGGHGRGGGDRHWPPARQQFGAAARAAP